MPIRYNHRPTNPDRLKLDGRGGYPGFDMSPELFEAVVENDIWTAAEILDEERMRGVRDEQHNAMLLIEAIPEERIAFKHHSGHTLV